MGRLKLLKNISNRILLSPIRENKKCPKALPSLGLVNKILLRENIKCPKALPSLGLENKILLSPISENIKCPKALPTRVWGSGLRTGTRP